MSRIVRLRPTGTSANERFLKNWRQIISFLSISKLLGKFDFSAQDLIRINGEAPIISVTEEVLIFVNTSKPSILLGNSWKNKRLFVDLVKEVADEFSVRNFDLLNKLSRFNLSDFEDSRSDKTRPKVSVSDELVQRIDELLSPQPWKPGLHRVISKQLSCTIDQYLSAVDLLIKKGIRNYQKDGVVYDSDGNVICFDQDRVDPDTLELLDE
jgi:hypothetical protein